MMIANNKIDVQKQPIQNFAFATGSKIFLYGGRTCLISSPDQKINTAQTTVIGTPIEQPQICHLCQKDFASLHLLQNHIKEAHLARNIIAVSNINGNQIVIPATSLQHHQYIQPMVTTTSPVKLEKDIQPKPPHQEYTTSTVANLNVSTHPVIQHIQIQPREKEKSNVVQVIKQNPVEYHIQQQEHAAQVVASINQKSGLQSPFFTNSTIKYELHAQPVQLVTEVYPQMLSEAPKNDDLNSHSSSSSPECSVIAQNTSAIVTNNGPMLSNGETMEKQHKCLVCDKFFTTVSNLNIHLKIHAGEKPYSELKT
jgi:Zinc finger, C2H2 type